MSLYGPFLFKPQHVFPELENRSKIFREIKKTNGREKGEKAKGTGENMFKVHYILV